MTQPVLDRFLPSERTTAGYLLRVSRPRFWLYLAGPVVVGVAYAARTPAELFAPIAVSLFAYFLVPANVFLYGVNDVFDADVDVDNPKKEGREVRYRGGRLVPALVALTGLLSLAFVPFVPLAGTVALGAFLILAVEYSAPRCGSRRPVSRFGLERLYILPGVVAYTAIAGVAPPAAAVVGGWLWTMGMHTFSAVPDIEPDRAAGIETTATVLGETRSYVYCGLCWLAAAAVFGFVHPFFTAVLGIYPVFVAFVAVSGVTSTARTGGSRRSTPLPERR